MATPVVGSRLKTAEDVVREVRNVFCVGRNYREHAHELGNAVPDRPMIFGKPTHAVVAARGMISLPSGRQEIHHELELVIWFSQAHEPGRPFYEAAEGIGLGLDLTDRRAQSQLKAAGHPWEFAKGFRHSAVVTDLYRVDDWDALAERPFDLLVDGALRQSGRAQEMIFSFQVLADYVATHFGLGPGDLLYTGTPAGVGPLQAGQQVVMRFDGQTWGEFTVA